MLSLITIVLWRLERAMATLTIRDLDDVLKLKLRLRAAGRNRSMEEEARQILRAALQEPEQAESTLVERIRKRFEGLGDVRLPIEPREPVRAPLEMHEPVASYGEAPGASEPEAKPARRARGPGAKGGDRP
jgi:plasmid stability protein